MTRFGARRYFDLNACNFTEKNMQSKDRRDGQSRHMPQPSASTLNETRRLPKACTTNTLLFGDVE